MLEGNIMNKLSNKSLINVVKTKRKDKTANKIYN